MRKVIVFFIFIVAVTCHSLIFASYDGKTSGHELCGQVERGFCERARIWNNFLMGQYTSLSELEEELKTTVTDPLLREDMKMFEQMLSIPTSYESISGVSVQNFHTVKSGFEKAVLEVSILWDIEGYENNYNEEVKYTVEMKKCGGNWLLSDYKVNNKQ